MKRRRSGPPAGNFLENTCPVRVRFQEVDSLRMTWHGHYLSYFEEGRSAFGREYQFGYEDIHAAGCFAPLVHVDLDYLLPTRYDEELSVRTRLHLVPGAKLVFTYLVSKATGEAAVRGTTEQIFTDHEGQLIYCRPEFFDRFVERWKERALHP